MYTECEFYWGHLVGADSVKTYPSCTFFERCHILLSVNIIVANPGGCLIAGIAGSNPAEGMDILLLCLLCVVLVAASVTS
jgi:hypothetical protein